MKKVLLMFALFLVIFGGLIFIQRYLNGGGFLFFGKIPTATINNQVFELIVAKSPKEREIGLSKTKSLPENKGMIFIFDKPGHYPFWMKDMTIPIDIIYINGQEIVTIQKNVQPPGNPIESPIIYSPIAPSDKVLEIQAGLSEKYSFKEGDKVKYENLSN